MIDLQIQSLIDGLNKEIGSINDKIIKGNREQNYHAHTGFDGSSKINLQGQKRFARILLKDQATIYTDATLGNHFYVTLTGNRALSNPTGAAPGQKIVFEFIQDATGSRTITLGSKFTLGNTITTITLTTTANKRDFMGVIYSDLDDKFYVVAYAQGY